jgi:hypothetical protein
MGMHVTFDEANSLLDECLEFLKSCGGVYDKPREVFELNVLDCIASDQYLIKRKGGKITTALFYWNVYKADLHKVRNYETPKDHYHGDILYIAEMGNKSTRQDAIGLVRKARQRKNYQGICCHRNKNGFRFRRGMV